MKKALLTKRFYFSASHARGREIHGHNYVLSVTVRYSPKMSENRLEENIQKNLIDKIQSRDLGLDVDFLKKTEITDLNLLKAFSPIIAREIRPARLAELSLSRDKNTVLSVAA